MLFLRWLGTLDSRYMRGEGGLATLIEIGVERAMGFQNLAHFVYCCEGIPNEERFATKPKIAPWVSSPEEPSSSLKKAIESTLRHFVTIATDRQYNQGFRTIEKKVAPVEFIFIGAYLGLGSEPMSDC